MGRTHQFRPCSLHIVVGTNLRLNCLQMLWPRHCARPPPGTPTYQAVAKSAPCGLIRRGGCVTVAEGYKGVNDAADGPLKPGELGLVVKDDLSGNKPWKVQVGVLGTGVRQVPPSCMSAYVLLVYCVYHLAQHVHHWCAHVLHVIHVPATPAPRRLEV